MRVPAVPSGVGGRLEQTIPGRSHELAHLRQIRQPDVPPAVVHTSSEGLDEGDFMANKHRRGRPHSFLPADREYLAELIRQHGIAGAQRRTAFSISDGTLLKIAREIGIVLTKGRRPKTAA